MKKLERRAILCLMLVAVILIGLGYFIFRFITEGNEWAAFYTNRAVNNSGHLSSESRRKAENLFDQKYLGKAGYRNDRKQTYHKRACRRRRPPENQTDRLIAHESLSPLVAGYVTQRGRIRHATWPDTSRNVVGYVP